MAINRTYQELFRLQGWQYSPLSVKRPRVVGKITNELVYEKLPPGVLEELKRLTPKSQRGNRTQRFHQRLTEDVGHPHLGKHLAAVTTLMRASPNKNVFSRLFARAFPSNKASQQEMDLGLDDSEEKHKVSMSFLHVNYGDAALHLLLW